MLPGYPVERGDALRGQPGELPRVHVNQYLIVFPMHPQPLAKLQVVQRRRQSLDVTRHPVRLLAHSFAGEEGAVSTSGIEVPTLAHKTGGDMGCRCDGQILHRHAIKPAANSLTQRIGVAHHEQKANVAKVLHRAATWSKKSGDRFMNTDAHRSPTKT